MTAPDRNKIIAETLREVSKAAGAPAMTILLRRADELDPPEPPLQRFSFQDRNGESWIWDELKCVHLTMKECVGVLNQFHEAAERKP